MADFNLSAEIALNLAKGAAASLKKQIQDGFKAPLEVDATEANKKIKKAQKEAKNSPIVIPIKLVDKDIKKNYADITAKLQKTPIEIEASFSKKSVKENLSNKALKALMGDRKPKVEIEAVFGKNTQKELDRLKKEIGSLIRYQEQLEKSIGETTKKVEAAPVASADGLDDILKAASKMSSSISKGDDAIEDFYRKLIKLNQESVKFGKSGAFGGGFFEHSLDQVKKLVVELDKIQPGQGLELLKQKFQGLSNEITEANLLGSLKVLYKAFSEIDTLEARLASIRKESPYRDISKELQLVAEARSNVSNLFFSGLNSADSSTFQTNVTAAMDVLKKSTATAVTSASRNINDYEKLLAGLAQKIAHATQYGDTKRVTDLGDLGARLTHLKDTGVSVSQARTDPEVLRLNAITQALTFIDIAADRASVSIETMIKKTTRASNELKNTKGGQLLDLAGVAVSQGKIAASRINAARSSKGTSSEILKEIDTAKNELTQVLTDVNKRAEKINGLFGRVNNQIDSFKANKFDEASRSLQNFLPYLEQLVKRGYSIETMDRVVSQKLAESSTIKALESKVKTAIKQIERLRNVLDFSDITDIAGANKKLNELQANLNTKTGQFAGLSPEVLDKQVAKGLFDVRKAQQFNEEVAKTANKLRAVGDANENLAVGKIYSEKAAEFERAAARIAAGSDSLGAKFTKLKALSNSTFINAKFEAEGGFLGSVAKSAGLAAKRLGAFLILAQGLYSVQSLFSQAFQDALKIDREFIKLEQVLNKDFGGNTSVIAKNLKNLKEQIFDLGKTLGVSTLEVANSAQILAQAGIQGKDLSILLSTVAKSQLGPSFATATETAEAAIAVFRQFNLTAEQTRDAIGGINALSAKYAVEAKGITEGVRRAGGVFATSGADIAEFAASFTLIKQQTREADESIATALRNVSQRLQSSNVQEYLKKTLNIDLVDQGEFIGFEKSITAIGAKLAELGASEKSPLFSQVREKIAGRLQAGRITPLLQDYEQYAELIKEFAKGSKSIQEDTITAFNAIENKLQRARSAVQQLFTEIIQSDLVKYAIEGFVQITTFATNLLRTLNSLPGAFLAIAAAAKLLSNSGFIAQAAFSQIVPRTTLFNKKNSGGPIGFNIGGSSGGHIPGRGPNKDTLLAALTKGEYVINRDSVDKYGVGFLDRINEGKFNSGGIVGYNNGGLTEKLLQAGFELTQGMVDKFVKKFTIENLGKGRRGSSNLKNQSIKLSDGSDLNTLAHEFGHIITAQLDKSELKGILKNLPDSIKKATYERIKRRQDVYGSEGTSKFKRSYQREVLADAVAALSHRSRGTNLDSPYRGDKGLDVLENAIKQKTGIGFNKPIPINTLSPYITNPSTALNPVGKTYVGKSNYSKPIAQAVKSAIKPIVSSRGSRVNFPSISYISSISSFGKSLISTKAGIISLGSAALLVSGYFSSLNSGISDLIITVASAAGSFYAISQLGGTVNSITSSLGLDTKGRVANRTSSIISNIRGTSVASATKKAAQLAAGGGIKSDAALLAATTKIGQKGKLAGVALTAGSGASVAGGKAAAAVLNQGGKISATINSLNSVFPKIASAGVKLATRLNIAGIAIGVVTGALTYFADQAEKSGKEELASAKTMKEAVASGSKIRFAQSVKVGLDKAGTILTGALSGAALGSAVAPGVGTIVGAISGGLIGAGIAFSKQLKKFLDFTGIKIFGGAFTILQDSFSKTFSKISDTLYHLTEGMDALVLSKLEDAKTFRLNKNSGKIAEQKRLGKIEEPLSLETIGDILGSVKATDKIIRNVGGGKFSDLTNEEQEKIKNEFEQIAGVFNQLSTSEQEVIVDAAQKMGLDLEETFKKVGVESTYIQQKAALAFDELSILFANMAQQTEQASSRLSGLEGGIGFFGNKDAQDFLPDQFYDILKAGFTPNELGLGGNARLNEAAQRSFGLAQQFDPRLVQNAEFDIKGRRTSRLTQQSIIGNPNLKIEPNQMEDFLKSVFNTASGEDLNSDLNLAFQKFVDTKGDDLKELADSSGRIDATKITGVFKEFADSLDSGALEEIKRVSAISRQFVDQYKSMLAERFALEGEALGYQKENIDRQKDIFELRNKASGLTGDRLAAVQGAQAQITDSKKLGNILTGTGLGQYAKPAELTAALLASQQRERGAGVEAQNIQQNRVNQLVASGKSKTEALKIVGGAQNLAQTQAELEAIEKERQNRIKAGLQYYANGTEVATDAMKEFERAAQKAATSSKFLSDALLGSDEQMAKTVLGLQAFSVVQKAFQQGGVGAAQSELIKFGEDARMALQNTLGADEDRRAEFERMVGISNNIAAGPEFAAAQGGIQQRQEANEGLAMAVTDLIPTLNQNIVDMKDFYASQFKNATSIIAQAEATAKNLVGQIAALPSVIEMVGNINVNLIGAGAIKELEAGLSEFVNKRIKVALENHTDKLVENNQGLNRPAPITTTDRLGGGGLGSF